MFTPAGIPSKDLMGGIRPSQLPISQGLSRGVFDTFPLPIRIPTNPRFINQRRAISTQVQRLSGKVLNYLDRS